MDESQADLGSRNPPRIVDCRLMWIPYVCIYENFIILGALDFGINTRGEIISWVSIVNGQRVLASNVLASCCNCRPRTKLLALARAFEDGSWLEGVMVDTFYNCKGKIAIVSSQLLNLAKDLLTDNVLYLIVS